MLICISWLCPFKNYLRSAVLFWKQSNSNFIVRRAVFSLNLNWTGLPLILPLWQIRISSLEDTKDETTEDLAKTWESCHFTLWVLVFLRYNNIYARSSILMESPVLVDTSETYSAKETLTSLLTLGDVLECNRVLYKEFKNCLSRCDCDTVIFLFN